MKLISQTFSSTSLTPTFWPANTIRARLDASSFYGGKRGSVPLLADSNALPPERIKMRAPARTVAKTAAFFHRRGMGYHDGTLQET
jgi:hypothetical protein